MIDRDNYLLLVQIMKRLERVELVLVQIQQAMDKLAVFPQISIVNTGRDTHQDGVNVLGQSSVGVHGDMIGGNETKRDEIVNGKNDTESSGK